MKLQDSLYNIVSRTPADGGEDFLVRLNAEHFIYKAHFPGEPITPGVCLLQMCVELLSLHVGSVLALSCAKNVKYLKIVVPDQTPELLVSLRKVQEITTDDGADVIKVQIGVSSEGEAYTKLSLECKRA